MWLLFVRWMDVDGWIRIDMDGSMGWMDGERREGIRRGNLVAS